MKLMIALSSGSPEMVYQKIAATIMRPSRSTGTYTPNSCYGRVAHTLKTSKFPDTYEILMFNLFPNSVDHTVLVDHTLKPIVDTSNGEIVVEHGTLSYKGFSKKHNEHYEFTLLSRMKLGDFYKKYVLASTSISLTLTSDIPNDNWLASKRKYNVEDGMNSFGAPRTFGPLTGSFSEPVLMPVSVLKRIPGLRGEQSNVRNEDLNWILKNFKRTNKLPQQENKDYLPFINVWHNGDPYVNEGNHRIMAADKMRYKYLPVVITYYSGGELEKNAILSPDTVKKYHAKALSEGYTLSNYGTHTNE